MNINLNKQKVEDFKITVVINETLPLKAESISVTKRADLKNGLEKDFTEAAIEFDEKVDEYYAKVEYVPEYHEEGNEWRFVLRYDVKRPNGNEIQIGAGRFIHHFKPETFEDMVKHVIFVIDVSGSMSGRKLKQTSDAMVHILNNLNENDSFDYFKFSDDVYEWLPRNRQFKEQRLKVYEVYEEAEEKMLSLRTIGGTNINDAMIKAIRKANEIKTNLNFDEVKDIMIIFLTDGEATTGVTNSEEIKENVKEANALNKFPIFGLAFGDGADFDLIKDISDENAGFASRIYESGNSFEQLENFYNEISDPKLRHAQFKYVANGKEIPPKSLSFNKIDHAFGHNEYTIIGEFNVDDNDNQNVELHIELQGDSNENQIQKDYTYNFSPCPEPRPLPYILDDDANSIPTTEKSKILCPVNPINPLNPSTPIETYQRSAAEKFMNKLWAYKRIQGLIEWVDDEDCDISEIYDTLENNLEDGDQDEDKGDVKSENQCKIKAIELAKEYNFVTKFTSMVVESNENYIVNYKDPVASDSQHDFNPLRSYNPVMRKARLGGNSLTSTRLAAGRGRGRGGGRGRHGAAATVSAHSGSSHVTHSLPQNVYQDVQHSVVRAYDYQESFHHSFPTTPAPTCLPSKLVLYSKTYFRGDSIEIADDVKDLSDQDFDDKVQSINVEGCDCWMVYVKRHFKGTSFKLWPREYKSAVDIKSIFRKASSIKKISCN